MPVPPNSHFRSSQSDARETLWAMAQTNESLRRTIDQTYEVLRESRKMLAEVNALDFAYIRRPRL
jgi:hypothetical protein